MFEVILSYPADEDDRDKDLAIHSQADREADVVDSTRQTITKTWYEDDFDKAVSMRKNLMCQGKCHIRERVTRRK